MDTAVVDCGIVKQTEEDQQRWCRNLTLLGRQFTKRLDSGEELNLEERTHDYQVLGYLFNREKVMIVDIIKGFNAVRQIRLITPAQLRGDVTETTWLVQKGHTQLTDYPEAIEMTIEIHEETYEGITVRNVYLYNLPDLGDTRYENV